MKTRPFVSYFLLASACLLPASLHAACDCAPIANSGLQLSCFSVNVNGTSAQKTEVSEGIQAWQSGCNSGGLVIPRMQMASSTNPDPCSAYPPEQVLNITVSFVGTQPGGSSPECGFADINFTTRTGAIEIYGIVEGFSGSAGKPREIPWAGLFHDPDMVPAERMDEELDR